MACRLIVNADDYGLTPGVSQGILHAHRAGILTSTTFMVNFPWTPEHVPALQATPTLAVGLHVNLTTGQPVTPAAEVPHLVDKAGQMQKQMLRLRWVPELELEREVRAQLLRFQALVGRLPTHLDTHRYTQILPNVARALARVAGEHGLPVRRIRPGEVPAGWVRPVLNGYLREAEAIFRAAEVAGPRHCLIGDFDLPRLLDRLRRLGEGTTEIVSHPAFVDDQLRAMSSLTTPRHREREALTDAMTRALVRRCGIELTDFRRLEG